MSSSDDKQRPETRNPDGTDWDRLRALTPTEIETAAATDPDAPPLAPGRKMRRLAISKRLRIRLGLSEAEFATRYRIPLETVQAWERHTSEPDAIARAYLASISANPDEVAKAVKTVQLDAAE